MSEQRPADDRPSDAYDPLYEKVWDQIIGPGVEAANAAIRATLPPPKQLLHFTTSGGLEAILRTGVLRLCRARASNDPLELEYSLRLSRTIIRHLSAETEQEREFIVLLEAGTRPGVFQGKKLRPPEPHVCCFAAPANGRTPTESDVALWSMYGRNGAGFGLVFDGEALARLPFVDFFPVSYDPVENLTKLRAVIQGAKRTVMAAHDLALSESTIDDAARMFGLAAHAFGSILAMYSAGMKAPMHEFEREWRLMISRVPSGPEDGPLEFGIQAGGSVLRSYYECPFPKEALRAVVVGAKHYNLNEFVVSAMLEHFGYEGTEVLEGKVNIRGADGT